MVELGRRHGVRSRRLGRAVDPERRRAGARSGRTAHEDRSGRACGARARRRRRARAGVEPGLGGAGRARGRQGADDRDRRLVEHARVLEHDREVARRALERPLAAGRSRPRLAERVRRAAARDPRIGAARLGPDDQLHQRAEPQARRQGEARPDAGAEPGSRRLSLGRRLHGRHPALGRPGAGDPGVAGGGDPRRADRARQRPPRCAGRPSPGRRADRADAGARDAAERRHRRPRGDQPEGVLRLRRLRLHPQRGRRGVRARPRCGGPVAALRAAARAARHRARGAARARRAAAAAALAQPGRWLDEAASLAAGCCSACSRSRSRSSRRRSRAERRTRRRASASRQAVWQRTLAPEQAQAPGLGRARRGDAPRHPGAQRGVARLPGLPGGPRRRDPGHDVPTGPRAVRGGPEAPPAARLARAAADRASADVVLGVVLSRRSRRRRAAAPEAARARPRRVRARRARRSRECHRQARSRGAPARDGPAPEAGCVAPSGTPGKKRQEDANPRNPTAPAREEGNGF